MKKYICILSAGLAFIPLASAKNKDKEHKDKSNHHEHREKGDKDDKSTEHYRIIEISNGEKQVVHDYILTYRQNKKLKSLPPGLAKKVARGESLPPGWQKKIARGEVMPFVVYQEITPLPEVILVKMPAQPFGTRLGYIDNKIVRIAEATRTIVDVFDLN